MASPRALSALCLAVAACGPGTSDPPSTPDAPPPPVDAAPEIDGEPVVRPDAAPPPDVQVVITADNAYSFGYGDAAGIDTYFQGTRATLAGEIFNCPVGNGPEAYTVPGAAAPDSAYLYVVSWDDLAVTQGVLGQFKRGTQPLYTGDAAWEVCATGVNLSSSTVGPTQDEVNTQIGICNAGTGSETTTSAGWVNTAGAITPGAVGTLAVGEMNDAASGTFPLVCGADQGGIDAAARWMWYQPGGIADPFRSTSGSNTFRAYLVFRLPASEIIID